SRAATLNLEKQHELLPGDPEQPGVRLLMRFRWVIFRVADGTECVEVVELQLGKPTEVIEGPRTAVGTPKGLRRPPAAVGVQEEGTVLNRHSEPRSRFVPPHRCFVGRFRVRLENHLVATHAKWRAAYARHPHRIKTH